MDFTQNKPKHQRNWTRTEIKVLSGYHNSGIDINDLIAIFNRTEKAIRAKAFYHGIKLGALA